MIKYKINGLAQACSNSNALVIELLQYSAEPLKWWFWNKLLYYMYNVKC